MDHSDTSPCEVLKVVDDPSISKRRGGCDVVVGDKLYLWGGEAEVVYSDSEDEEEDEEDEEDEDPPFKEVVRVLDLPRECNGQYRFDVFDLRSLSWSMKDTHGLPNTDIPLVGTGSTLSYHDGTNSIYLYGGWNDHRFTSDVYCISMDTWKWEMVVIPEGGIKPSPRYLTGVVIHGDKLCNFGGVGLDIVAGQDVGAKYLEYVEKAVAFGYGWNNEYYEFDVIERKWDAPMSRTNRARPPPVSAHVFTKYDDRHVLCYGGRTEDGWSNATWIFDLENKEFEGPLSCNERPSPPPRTLMTLCPLIAPEVVGQSLCPGGPPVEQTLLLLWGRKTRHLIIDDCWLFHCKNKSWTKITVGELGRFFHTASSYFCEPGKTTECQVVVYGGCKHGSPGTKDLTILSFGTKSLEKLCQSVIVGALKLCVLEPGLDQLPEYVPTTIKQEILDVYLAHTHKTK